MKHLHWIGLLLATTISGCAVVGSGPGGSPEMGSTDHSGGVGTAGPVVLTLGGQGSDVCRFTLFARYPEGLAVHTVDAMIRVQSTTTGFTSDGGFYQELPMLGVDWTERTPAGYLTALNNGVAEEPCANLTGMVQIVSCVQGACPRYEADAYSDIALTVINGD